MSLSVPWFPYCPLVLPLTHLSLSSTFRKHLTHHGSRGLWCGFLMLVSGAVLHGTQSQVRCGSSLPEPWVDSLINSLIASVRQVAPGVQFCSSSLRVPGQLYADDLELSAECEFALQVALDAVARWGRQWRFSFGIGPTKSSVMVFGPRRSIPPCSVHLGGDLLPIVMEGDSDSHSLMDCPRPSGSPCALLPPCSPPTCCPASLGGLSSSSLLLL